MLTGNAPFTVVSIFLQIQSGDALVSAESTAVQPGAQVLQTLLDYSVGINIAIENWSKFPLSGVSAKAEGGKIQEVPAIIRGGMEEFMAAHKTNWSLYGSFGIVSWRIEGFNKRLVLMWHVPYLFLSHSNYLAVGLTTSSTKHNGTWFDYMYYDDGDITDLKFKRHEFDGEISELLYDDDPQFQIHASMGTSYMTEVRVVVRPKNDSDLAQSIQETVK